MSVSQTITRDVFEDAMVEAKAKARWFRIQASPRGPHPWQLHFNEAAYACRPSLAQRAGTSEVLIRVDVA